MTLNYLVEDQFTGYIFVLKSEGDSLEIKALYKVVYTSSSVEREFQMLKKNQSIWMARLKCVNKFRWLTWIWKYWGTAIHHALAN